MNSFTHAPRGRMTPQRALKVYQDADGKCAACKRKLGPADSWDVDHIVALENGGTDADVEAIIETELNCKADDLLKEAA